MKIIGIGRNYSDHAKELNNVLPTEPIVFMKPDTSLLKNNEPFYFPSFSSDIHHEIELVVKISKEGKCIQEKFASKYYDEIGIGIDFTARDLQAKCKAKGLPWEMAKAFDYSAPMGKFIPKSKFADINNIPFHLDINGKTVQEGNTKDLLYSFDSVIEYVSKFVTLKMGDFIFTGTPSGVGPVAINDTLEAYIANEKLLEVRVK